MMQLLLVAVGGAIGAVARWSLGGLVLQHTLDWRFPAGTFLVNAVGCLAAGLLAGLVTRLHILSLDMRLLLFTGLLGGFTTFSALGIETVGLMRRGELAVAFAYILSTMAASVGAVWLGMLLIPTRSSP